MTENAETEPQSDPTSTLPGLPHPNLNVYAAQGVQESVLMLLIVPHPFILKQVAQNVTETQYSHCHYKTYVHAWRSAHRLRLVWRNVGESNHHSAPNIRCRHA